MTEAPRLAGELAAGLAVALGVGEGAGVEGVGVVAGDTVGEAFATVAGLGLEVGDDDAFVRSTGVVISGKNRPCKTWPVNMRKRITAKIAPFSGDRKRA